MKIKLAVEKDFEVKYLQVEAYVRYWEDSVVNGEEDVTGSLIPCREGDAWKPLIDIENGVILNWVIGKTADIHYKVCDEGTYTLLDECKNAIISKEGYVPKIMCPKREGYGDYIIMDIDENGQISDWEILLSDLLEND